MLFAAILTTPIALPYCNQGRIASRTTSMQYIDGKDNDPSCEYSA